MGASLIGQTNPNQTCNPYADTAFLVVKVRFYLPTYIASTPAHPQHK